MIIYPFVDELDDEQLGKQIEAIAQTLCNVHWLELDREIAKGIEINHITIPLDEKNRDSLFTRWATECRANYVKLVDMGLQACYEYIFRFHPCEVVDIEYPINSYKEKELIWGDIVKVIEHKRQYVIEWARDNVPDLMIHFDKTSGKEYWKGLNDESMKGVIGETTPFPVVMTDEYLGVLN